MSKLLRPVSAINVRGMEHFVAEDFLKRAHIGSCGRHFKRLFLRKIETNVPDCKIVVFNLEKNALEPDILTALGNSPEILLAHFFRILEQNDIDMVVNGHFPVPYVRENGDLWSINAHWTIYNGVSIEANQAPDDTIARLHFLHRFLSYKSD